MTFVIKDNFDSSGFLRDDYIFDLEGYNYILGRNTILTQGSLVKYQFDKLSFILGNFQKHPDLMEILYYMNSDKQLPLHIAV